MYISEFIQVYAKYEPSKHVSSSTQFSKKGERIYKCDQCSSAFVHLYSLTLHKRKHSGIFACMAIIFPFKSVFPLELFIFLGHYFSFSIVNIFFRFQFGMTALW